MTGWPQMLEPVGLDSVVSRQLLSQLEGAQVEISSWHSRLSQLETDQGIEVYSHLFYVIGHLDLKPQLAKSYWEGAHGAWVGVARPARGPLAPQLPRRRCV